MDRRSGGRAPARAPRGLNTKRSDLRLPRVPRGRSPGGQGGFPRLAIGRWRAELWWPVSHMGEGPVRSRCSLRLISAGRWGLGSGGSGSR